MEAHSMRTWQYHDTMGTQGRPQQRASRVPKVGAGKQEVPFPRTT